MMRDTNLNEIREKIYQLRTAIMYSMSNDVCRLPNSIVNALKVDDHGKLWFICPRPLQKVSELEGYFPARLKFYHKGVLFHVEVSGRTQVVQENYSGAAPVGYMLLCMEMNSIEYTEPYGKKEKSRIEHIVDKGYRWMLRHISLPVSISRPGLSRDSAFAGRH